jgi:hypothetical protein
MGGSVEVKEPIFVCGLGRSGTTWLSNALGQSPELVYIREAWLIGKFEELVGWYSMIYDEWKTFTPWNEKGVDRAKFMMFLSRFYRELLDSVSGGKRFIEKTPDWNVLHLKLLNELFPAAHYVLVYRDGRNHVASLEAKNRREQKDFDFAKACRKWAKAMDVFEEIETQKTIRNFTLVRYEDLLLRFDETFLDLCRFVRIEPFTPEPVEPNSSFENRHTPDDFANRWRSWSEERRNMFTRYAGAQLVKWKYAHAV